MRLPEQQQVYVNIVPTKYKKVTYMTSYSIVVYGGILVYSLEFQYYTYTWLSITLILISLNFFFNN